MGGRSVGVGGGSERGREECGWEVGWSEDGREECGWE